MRSTSYANLKALLYIKPCGKIVSKPEEDTFKISAIVREPWNGKAPIPTESTMIEIGHKTVTVTPPMYWLDLHKELVSDQMKLDVMLGTEDPYDYCVEYGPLSKHVRSRHRWISDNSKMQTLLQDLYNAVTAFVMAFQVRPKQHELGVMKIIFSYDKGRIIVDNADLLNITFYLERVS